MSKSAVAKSYAKFHFMPQDATRLGWGVAEEWLAGRHEASWWHLAPHQPGVVAQVHKPSPQEPEVGVSGLKIIFRHLMNLGLSLQTLSLKRQEKNERKKKKRRMDGRKGGRKEGRRRKGGKWPRCLQDGTFPVEVKESSDGFTFSVS